MAVAARTPDMALGAAVRATLAYAAQCRGAAASHRTVGSGNGSLCPLMAGLRPPGPNQRSNSEVSHDRLRSTPSGRCDFRKAAGQVPRDSTSFAAPKLPFVTSRTRPSADRQSLSPKRTSDWVTGMLSGLLIEHWCSVGLVPLIHTPQSKQRHP